MKRWPFAVVCAPLAVAAACSSFDGTANAPVVDAGVDVTVAPPTSDAAPADEDAAIADAGVDAADASFCVVHAGAESCLDFDGTENPFPNWTTDFGGANSKTPTVQAGDAISMPNAMLVSLDKPITGSSKSRLLRELDANVQSLRLTFHVKLSPIAFGNDNNDQIALAEAICATNAVIDNYDGPIVSLSKGADANTYLIGVSSVKNGLPTL